MNKIKESIKISLSRHTVPQKMNYIKYLMLNKSEVLNYDPVTLSIVATTRCTLSCDMCPTHSSIVPKDYPHTQKARSDMNFAMFRDIIDRFRNATTVHIIGSGEPLLNKDFFRMVDYAARNKMVVKTFSNGTLVEDNIDNILSSKLNGITVSINGHDGKEFKRMTGMDEGVYYKIYTGVKKLVEQKKSKKSGVKVKLSFIIDKMNYKLIHEMIDLSLDLGVDHAFFCNFLPSPFKGLSADERVLPADNAIMSEMKDALRIYPSEVRSRFTLPIFVDIKEFMNKCRTHFSQIRFDGDGNVSSCSMMLLDMTGHGNYKDADVWNNAFFRDMRRRFLSPGDELIPEPCSVCPDNRGVEIG